MFGLFLNELEIAFYYIFLLKCLVVNKKLSIFALYKGCYACFISHIIPIVKHKLNIIMNNLEILKKCLPTSIKYVNVKYDTFILHDVNFLSSSNIIDICKVAYIDYILAVGVSFHVCITFKKDV